MKAVSVTLLPSASSFLASVIRLLTMYLDDIECSWSARKSMYRAIIVLNLVGLLTVGIVYYKAGELTLLDVIGATLLSCSLHMNVKEYLESRIEHKIDVNHLKNKLNEIEQELDQ